MNDDSEILLKLIEEQWALVRHYEDQRATVTNYILIVTSLAIGFITQAGIVIASLPVSILLVFLGMYGAITVAKLYERTQFSSAFAKHYLDRVDECYPNLALAQIREKVRSNHKIKFPISAKLHMHHLWGALHIIISLAGLLLTTMILVSHSA